MHRPCLLMYLALKDDGLATIAEIAESYGISKNHLMKVAHQLGVAGYVATVRGRSGGLRLAKPAEAALLVRCTRPRAGTCRHAIAQTSKSGQARLIVFGRIVAGLV
jgi:Iron-dependent Transcriptional regulator